MANVFRTVIRIITCIALLICPMPTEKKCEAEFNGTFLQSWMSSYWDDERWQDEIGAMKEAGIKYLIIQDVANKASDGTWTVYYNSNLDTFSGATFGAADVVESALRNCSGSGIKVMIGLGLYDEWWTKSGFGKDYSELCNVSADMIEEIYNKYVSKYPDAFYGWYFTPEMSNGPLVKLSSPFIAKGVNVIIDAIERTDADAPLLLSPFFSQYGANPGIESAKLFWASFIKSVNFREHDIFCPQDAVGAGWTIEENLVNVWRMYSDAVKLSGKSIRLWANVENFTSAVAKSNTTGITTPLVTENTQDVTATLDRLVKQMDIASRYAENIITFSYNHYYSPVYVDPMFHNTYVDYLKHGHVLESEAPTAPTDLGFSVDGDGNTVVNWQASTDNFGVAYYRICADGKFLTRCEYNEDTAAVIENAQSGTVYSITAYDAAGNASQAAEIVYQ